MKMKDRNAQLQQNLGAMAPKERVVASQAIPEPDTVNRQGFAAYALPDKLRLITMLNTLKLEPQYYRSENDTMKELRDLIERIASKEPYFVAQAIAWSRNQGEGMRSINHLAAALLSPFASGQEWAKRFYGPYNRNTKSGGCIFRPDDMREIKDVYDALNKGTLSNAMKKGFAHVIEGLSTYQIGKYRQAIVDIANLVHPDPRKSKATIKVEGEDKKVLDLIMHGETISADTWEVANAEAGQEVAKAVKEGKLDAEEAKTVLQEAKNDNWEALLDEGKLGILAAVRNIRNMLKGERASVKEKLCALVRNGELIRKARVMPYQLDLAYEVVNVEFSDASVMRALADGYEMAVPNLAEALPGKTCVFVDCSGSMYTHCTNQQGHISSSTACQKAGLIAATIAKATGADVVRFGDTAKFFPHNYDKDVFTLGREISRDDMGCTYMARAFDLIRRHKLVYDRIIILSDYECNRGAVSDSYRRYVREVCDPYVYCVDLAGYGTAPVRKDGKVNYYFGYGYAMFDDIATREFNPQDYLKRIEEYVI